MLLRLIATHGPGWWLAIPQIHRSQVGYVDGRNPAPLGRWLIHRYTSLYYILLIVYRLSVFRSYTNIDSRHQLVQQKILIHGNFSDQPLAIGKNIRVTTGKRNSTHPDGQLRVLSIRCVSEWLNFTVTSHAQRDRQKRWSCNYRDRRTRMSSTCENHSLPYAAIRFPSVCHRFTICLGYVCHKFTIHV